MPAEVGTQHKTSLANKLMAMPPKYLLRVYIATDVAVKVTLNERPTSVDELIGILKDKVNPRLDFEFTLQYEDPDFGGELCCLVDVEDLPEKGTLRVVRSESDLSSCASSDTDILPHVPVSQRQKTWPDVFPVPTFSYEVEHVLQEGNSVFESSGKNLKLSRAQKHNILENMASLMYSFKPYPSDRDVGMAAEALINAHPCLKEPGSASGWYGWKISLKFKMGNYRTRLARSGCKEVSVNTGKRSRNNPEKAHPHSNIKKARRAEVNFLPNFPRGQNEDSLEEMRIEMKAEVDRADRNLQSIEKLMQTTFALRRQEIVQGDPLVKDFLERWPALQVQSQVCAEFHRITNVNLRNQFYSELDRHIPQLIELYRQKAARTGRVAGALRDILQYYETETEESEEPDIGDTPIAIVTMVRERSASPVHFSPVSTAIVVEDEFIIRDIATFADAYVLLFGLVYVLHLDYPKKLLGTFTFIQKVVMGLDDGAPLKPALLALKNDLLTK
ncbi:uncharacterized protein LOC125886568 isoform X3 [Epinephelus fuscoguttatus]|uniref:uncharacterized protein LOC125886568 isoform X3 n=1 Tax=Epinephelus fuscoguttatus TaxID=293821 RepID=UPI0020D088B6|nr:uncharacterized protein LOC125886568 isoform X3 [Epinephelus fuscoguttatus]